MIAVRVLFPPAVLDHGPRLRLAGAAEPQPGVEGRGDHGAAPGADGAPPPGSPAPAGLGRPGGIVRAGPAAASRAARQSAGHAGDSAGLAPPSDHPQVDLPGSAGPPGDRTGDPRPGAAAGGGEPRLGIPPGAGRADAPRPSCERGDCAADPPCARLPACSPWPGYLMAEVLADSGGRLAGV